MHETPKTHFIELLDALSDSVPEEKQAEWAELKKVAERIYDNKEELANVCYILTYTFYYYRHFLMSDENAAYHNSLLERFNEKTGLTEKNKIETKPRSRK